MPLYKKTTSKARVKTQSSFISPLFTSQASIAQNKIKDLLKDDYKSHLHIPTTKKLLEPLINISKDGDLLDKLQQKSFKHFKTKETWSGKDRDGANKENAHKFKDLVGAMDLDNAYDKYANVSGACSPKSIKNTLTRARSKAESSRALSELNAQSSPLLFGSSPSSVQSSNKRFRTEKSMIITTKIEISENTDENIFNVKRACETPNSHITDLWNDCVTNNLKMSQQFFNPGDLTDKGSVQTGIGDDARNIQRPTSKSRIGESEDDLDASLRSILDEVVNENIMLSQNMKANDNSNQNEIEAIKSKKKQDKQAQKPNTQKTKTKPSVAKVIKKATGKTKPMSTEETETESSLRSILDDLVNTNIILSQNMMTEGNSSQNVGNTPMSTEENEAESTLRSILDDVANTNIILSQKMMTEGNSSKNVGSKPRKYKDSKPEKKKAKNKTDLKKSAEKSKENIRHLPKSKENIKSSFKPTLDDQSNESIKIKSFKRVRALCSEDDDQLEQSIVSPREVNKNVTKKNQTAEKLKEKIKNKYLIEKKSPVKRKGEKSQNNINLKKEQSKDHQEKKEKILKPKGGKGGKQSGGKKLERSKSSITDNQHKGKEVAKKAIKRPPKHKNMIFTSEKTNKMDLEKALELQEERDVGLYVYCDTCDKVRYLEQCKDPLELPEKWYCHMNPDPNYNTCSDPNFEIELEKEELIIFNKFNAGSIVWAKMDGFPWWPAMVDDDPDVIDYFWLDDENSREPSWYHVTFFDSSDVTRAWIRTANLEPFGVNVKNPLFRPKKYDLYRNRLAVATNEAKAACKMGILQRLRTYSFVVRHSKKQNHTQKKDRPNIVKNTEKSVDNTDSRTEKMPRQQTINNDATLMEENMDFDNISIASSEFITSMLKSKKPGRKIVSEDEILENIELNCSEDPFNIL